MSQKGRVERGEGTGSGDGGGYRGGGGKGKTQKQDFPQETHSLFFSQSSNKGALIRSSSDLGQVV